ncbi:hypothetical protein GCM10023196_094740 [Actinoallomurus vinaceus]|uniref:Secreted protein n=1 Tax=Actinoallomurus vinaceus TaxID=1080074 RepID=A0ABP8UR75_9ACTN
MAALFPGMSSASAAVDHDPCRVGQTHYCIGPTRVTQGSQCPGSQYFKATDGYGVSINWTYSNNNVSCVRVDYNYDLIREKTACQYWFYVPAGHATAPIYIGYWTHPYNKKYVARLDENAHEGWTHVFDAAQVYDIQFQDNNGTTAGTIGWGDSSAYGWSVWC